MFRASDGVPEFSLHTSNVLSNSFDKSIDARMFPHLFPYGRGHPGETRRVAVSRGECIRHYCLLSSRRFAQDHYFVLTSFDRLSLERAYTMSNISCKGRPDTHHGVANITSDQLRDALASRRSRKCGQETPASTLPPPDPVVEGFLRSVDCSSAYVWGSNAERRAYRRKALATCDRFGQPAVFMTLTPNTDE